MSTSPDVLDELLRGVPPAPPRGLPSEARRAPAAAAPVRRERDELDDLLEATPAASATGLRVRRSETSARPAAPAPTAPAAPAATSADAAPGYKVRRPPVAAPAASGGVDSRLDSFVNDVIGEASKRSGYTYRLGEGVRTPEQQAGKVASGVSWTLNSRHLSGRGRDVTAHDPTTGEYLKDATHPAYATLGEVYAERAASSPVRVRWGVLRDGRQVDPGHFELEPDDELDDLLAGVPAADGAQAAQPQGDALDELLADVPAAALDDEGGEIVRVNSVPASRPVASSSSGLRVRRPPAPLDPYSSDDRARRDAAAASPVVALTFKPPRALADYNDASEFMADAYREAARARNVDPEFLEGWLKSHPEVLRLVRRDTNEAAMPADLIGTSSHDPSGQRVRLELSRVGEMARDYEAWRSTASRAIDWATDDQTTAGEKATSAASILTRPLGTLSTGAAGLQRSVSTSIGALAGDEESQKVLDSDIYSPVNIIKATFERFKTGNVPEGYEQPIAQGLDLLYQKKNKMPLPAWRRMALEIIGDPMTYASLNLVGEGARALKGTRVGQRLLDRGLTVLDIERAADDGGGYLIKLKDADGATHTIDTAATPAPAAGGRAAADASDDELDALIRDIPDDPNLTEFIPVRSAATPAATPAALNVRRAGVGGRVLDVIGLPKSFLSSLDVSAPGRQGLILSVTEPRIAASALRQQFRSLVSSKAYKEVEAYLATHADIELAEACDLYLPTLTERAGNLAGKEEAFPSRVASHIFGIKHSERAYNSYLSVLRLKSFSKYADELRRAGLTFADNPDEFRALAGMVNSMTGRGNLPTALEKAAPVLNAIVFSPRNIASRVSLLNPATYLKSPPAVRKIMMRKMIEFAGVAVSTLTAARLAGADVTLDPESADFLKIRVGKTHYDVLGGFQQPLRLLGQLSTGLWKLSRGEEIKRGLDPLSVLARFAYSKSSPVASYAIGAYTGKKIDGADFDATTDAARQFAPLFLQDLWEAMQADGARGVALALPAGVGVGVQTYAVPTDSKPIAPTLSQPVQAELTRLGLDLQHLGKKGKTSVYVRPRRTVEGITGDSITPFGGEETNSGMGMDAASAAKRLSVELEAALSEEIAHADYKSMSDADRARRLTVVMLGVEKRLFNETRTGARRLQLDEEKRIIERQNRMAAPTKDVQHFKL